MNKHQKPVSLEKFNNLYKNEIEFCHKLENYLECSYPVYDTCLTLTILCQGLESNNLEGSLYTRQRIQNYYTQCVTKLNEHFQYDKSLPLDFDDLTKLKTQLTNLKNFTGSLLSLARNTSNHIERLPELLYVIECMSTKGFPIDDIFESFVNTEAEVKEFLASKPSLDNPFSQINIKLNTYCIQVQKLERWIHQKAIETSPNITQSPHNTSIIPTESKDPNTLSKILEKIENLEAAQKAIETFQNITQSPHNTSIISTESKDPTNLKLFEKIENLEAAHKATNDSINLLKLDVNNKINKLSTKKDLADFGSDPEKFIRDNKSKNKPGPQPTRDTKSRQCKMMWELSHNPDKHYKSVYALAREVIRMKEWNNPKYKCEKLFTYTGPKNYRNIQNRLVARFKSYCRDKIYPTFPT